MSDRSDNRLESSVCFVVVCSWSFFFFFCKVGKYLEKSGCWIKEKIGVLGVL